MELEPVRRRSAADHVFDQLLGRVVSGDIPPGTRLPAERALTESLKVNRQTVREALQRLVQAGLVHTHHGGGSRVLDYRTEASLDLLPSLLVRTDGSVDSAVVRAIFEMRACIGPDVAARCAARAPAGLAQELAALAAAVAAAGTPEERARRDLDFWDLLVDGADNIAYRLAFNSLARTYEPVVDAVSTILAPELDDAVDRSAIAAAVGRGDAAGAEAAARRLLAVGSVEMSRWLDALAEGEER
ncbi:MAG: FadR/GntR family transcriptional regulator [Actinomycetota bacterium]